MPDGQVLEFTRVTKRFNDVTAVSDFSARVEPGVVTAFLGPNGAGKTTTLRILLGQVRPTSGTATIGGVAFADLRTPLRVIGSVLEETVYRPRRTANRQLTIAAKANGIPLSRIDEVLALVGLEGEGEGRIGSFSLGMRQRLSVAHALLGDPGTLVFDEPANGLDPEGIRWMRLLMRRLADEGRTVLVSSHVLSEVEQIADNVLVLSKGQLVLSSGIEKLADPSAGSVVVDAADRAALRTALGQAGFEVEVLRSGLTVRGADAGTVGAVAASAGVALSTLVQRGPTLEDVFIELVRGGRLEPRAVAAASQLVLAETDAASVNVPSAEAAPVDAVGVPPVSGVPVTAPSVEETQAEAPVEEASDAAAVDEASDATVVEQTSAESVPAEAPVEDASDAAPVEEAPAENVPAEAPVEEAPDENVPAEAPVEEAPVEEAPDDDSTEETAEPDSPVEDAPADVDDPFAGLIPVEDAPDAAPVEEAPDANAAPVLSDDESVEEAPEHSSVEEHADTQDLVEEAPVEEETAADESAVEDGSSDADETASGPSFDDILFGTGAAADAHTDDDADAPDSGEHHAGVEVFAELGHDDDAPAENDEPTDDDLAGAESSATEAVTAAAEDEDPRSAAVSSMLAAAARAYYEDEPRDYPLGTATEPADESVAAEGQQGDEPPAEESRGESDFVTGNTAIIDAVPLAAPAGDSDAPDSTADEAHPGHHDGDHDNEGDHHEHHDGDHRHY
ncbi:MAG: ATP-binding cassette domain-containing protein [Microbacterium sp.]|nr:ATP-binding cassette domain-containing protein [Microbacterium sp.]